MTQTDLANRLSVTRSSVNAWEMGISIPSVEKVVDLACFFHVTTDYILGVEEEQCINVSTLTVDELELLHRLLFYFDNVRRQS